MTCRVCGVDKPLDKFLRHGSARNGRQSKCSECAERQASDYRKMASRRWRLRNPEAYQRALAEKREYRLSVPPRPPEPVEARRARVLRRHGLAPDAYDAMLSGQGGGCAICGVEPEEGKFLHIDHDHETEAVRGLLCKRCNMAIGLLADDPDRVIAAAMYLARAMSVEPFRRGERF